MARIGLVTASRDIGGATARLAGKRGYKVWYCLSLNWTAAVGLRFAVHPQSARGAQRPVDF
jgi:hypothetical protein